MAAKRQIEHTKAEFEGGACEAGLWRGWLQRGPEVKSKLRHTLAQMRGAARRLQTRGTARRRAPVPTFP